MSGVLGSVRRIVEGTAIVVFSAVLIGAGTIVWTASTSYKQEMRSYFKASTEVFSTDIAELSSEVRILREEIEQLQKMIDPPTMEALSSETAIVEELQISSDDDNVEENPAPRFTDQYQSFKKDQILNRINEQQQIQQTRN